MGRELRSSRLEVSKSRSSRFQDLEGIGHRVMIVVNQPRVEPEVIP